MKFLSYGVMVYMLLALIWWTSGQSFFTARWFLVPMILRMIQSNMVGKMRGRVALGEGCAAWRSVPQRARSVLLAWIHSFGSPGFPKAAGRRSIRGCFVRAAVIRSVCNASGGCQTGQPGPHRRCKAGRIPVSGQGARRGCRDPSCCHSHQRCGCHPLGVDEVAVGAEVGMRPTCLSK